MQVEGRIAVVRARLRGSRLFEDGWRRFLTRVTHFEIGCPRIRRDMNRLIGVYVDLLPLLHPLTYSGRATVNEMMMVAWFHHLSLQGKSVAAT
jgi:hypothetical protein